MPDKKKPRRKARKQDPERLRREINVLALIEALEEHVMGKKKMSPTQVSAALALLKKILPDLSGPSKGRTPEKQPAAAHEDALNALE